MKKLTAILFVLALILSLAACRSNETPSVETPAIVPTATVEQDAGDHTDATQDVPDATALEATDPAIQETDPEVTESTETEPAETEPAETEPAETEPAETEPVATEPTETEPQPTQSTPTDSEHEHQMSRIEKTYTYCDERGLEHHYCDCGYRLTFVHTAREHTLSRNTIIQATREEEGLAEVKCIWCPYTTTEVIPVVTTPYFVGFELVSVERVNAYYLSNGQDLLTRLYGKNKAFQKGDSLVLKVIMSDGGDDFRVVNYPESDRCTCTKEGNLIYVKFDAPLYGITNYASISIEVERKNGEIGYEGEQYYICNSDHNLGQSGYCFNELQAYGKRLGMQWVTNGTDFVHKYNGGYTWDDESLSLTGCTIRGTDDVIYLDGNPDWIEEAIWLLDKYAEMGFVRFNFAIYGGAFSTLAE